MTYNHARYMRTATGAALAAGNFEGAMTEDNRLFLGASRKPDDTIQQQEFLDLKFANRHGLVTGATGTGKTVTLQILAEGFSNAGVPVFAADIKGDLSGVGAMGEPKDFLAKRAKQIGLDPYENQEFPAIFWDLFGEQGHPIRTTISEMGPLLLSRLMNLTEAQEGVLNIAFRIADEDGLLLLDMKDLQSLLTHVAERAKELSMRYGNVNAASVGAIQRSLLVLEQQGGSKFFGEPALRIADIMRTTPDGRGAINILAADKLMMNPRLYATFLLWLMSELFEQLPEIGDPEKPRLVFFFDEAHLLFDQAPKILVDRVEQVVRLIRSKGVGVYFVTQNPLDVPDSVLAQLGNRIQHALRAYTPREQKAVKTAADTFRPNPDFDTFEQITKLGTGEALVSTLEAKGAPSVVQRTLIRPPASRLGPITPEERRALLQLSPVFGQYDQTIDRESAYEILMRRAQDLPPDDGRFGSAPRDKARGRNPWGTEPPPLPDAGGGAQTGEEGGRGRWTLPDFGDGRRSERYSGEAARRDQPYRPDDDDDDDDDRRRERPSADRYDYEEPRRRSTTTRTSTSSRPRSSGYQRESVAEAAMKSVARSVSSSLGRAIVRGILGSLKR